MYEYCFRWILISGGGGAIVGALVAPNSERVLFGLVGAVIGIAVMYFFSWLADRAKPDRIISWIIGAVTGAALALVGFSIGWEDMPPNALPPKWVIWVSVLLFGVVGGWYGDRTLRRLFSGQ